MVTMAQSAANWRKTHTHVDRMHSVTHLHHHSYNHVVQSASSAITEFGIKFLFWRYLSVGGGGGKPDYLEKTPDTDSLPTN